MSTAPHASLTRTVIAGTVGNVLEWYDFGLFGSFRRSSCSGLFSGCMAALMVELSPPGRSGGMAIG
jgi:hypothetical protein